jgi:hypothetical protein
VTDDIQLRMSIQLDAYSSQPGVPSVVDADALLSSIRNQSVTGWQSRLSQLGESARTPIFASQHVYWEVYRKLPKLAVGSGASIVDFRDSSRRTTCRTLLGWALPMATVMTIVYKGFQTRRMSRPRISPAS